jgi:mannosyltransferase
LGSVTKADLAGRAGSETWDRRKLTWAGISALTVVAFALRVGGMDQSLLGDELFAYAEIHDQSLTGVVEQVKDSVEVSPPLYFVLAWASAQIGDPTVWIRLPSLVFGTALVPLTYALGARTVGHGAGIVGAALLALSPFAIFYSTEARPYATLAFFAVLSTLLLLRAIQSGGWWWVAYTLASCAVIYTHYTGIFVLVAQAAVAATAHRERLVALALSNAGAALLFLPWISEVRGKGQLDVYGAFSVSWGLLGRPAKALVGHPLLPLDDVPGVAALVVIAAAVAAAGALAGRRRLRFGHALLAALAVCTPLGMLGTAAVTGDDLFIVRNFTASVPAALLCLGALLTAAPPRVSTVLSIAALFGVGVGTAAILSEDRQRAQAREAAELLDRRAAPRDVVVTVAPTDTTSNRPLDPYLERPHVRVFGDAANYPAAFRDAADAGVRVFVVFPGAAEVRPLIRPPSELRDRFELRGEYSFPGFSGGLVVREFAPRP